MAGHAEDGFQFGGRIKYVEKGFYFYPMCAYTFAEPIDARHWFPCHDVPWDKATAELHITVPKGVEVASIGLLEGRDLSEDMKMDWYMSWPICGGGMRSP